MLFLFAVLLSLCLGLSICSWFWRSRARFKVNGLVFDCATALDAYVHLSFLCVLTTVVQNSVQQGLNPARLNV